MLSCVDYLAVHFLFVIFSLSCSEGFVNNYLTCLFNFLKDIWEELYQHQLVGINPSLWNLPRVMARVIKDKFEAERNRTIQLRK